MCAVTLSQAVKTQGPHCLLSKNEGKDQESIQSSTTPDPGYQWESDKNNLLRKKYNFIWK